ncbi:MAG: hypothetical protein JWO60_1025 [Frankiales bacterium]|nr:hypothetical protein [Frankiales bacterium]
MPDVSSLQLLVPGAEPLLDAVRGLPGVGLLEPAHVSLGYPWRQAEDADPDVVARAAALVPPFVLRFGRLGRFDPDQRGRVVLHAVPDDDRHVRILAAVVGGDLHDTHLSVARVLPEGDIDDVAARVEHLLPLECRVEVLELTVQEGRRWLPGTRFPLGG